MGQVIGNATKTLKHMKNTIIIRLENTMFNTKHVTNHLQKAKDKNEYVNLINRGYVKRMKEFCEAHGAKFVLVSTPSTTNWNMRKHNGIVKLASDLGVEFLDFNVMTEEVPIDWTTDTRDGGDHLNDSGAEKVSAYIGNYLASTGLFADKRTNAEYSAWNEYLEAFNKMKQEA